MSFGEFVLAFLTLYCMFFYFMILFRVLDDVFRDPARSGWAKTGWVLFLLVVPVIAMIVYLIGNGADMATRAMDRVLAQEQRQREYIREAAGTADGSTAEIARAHDLLLSGAVTESEFDAMKAKALASAR